MVAIRFCLSLAFSTVSAQAAAAVFHVSPQGRDTWTGAIAAPNPGATDGPLASLAGARDAVRARLAQGNLDDTLRVLFADGEYLLDRTVVFTPADGGSAAWPVVYQAAPGAHPVFLGGREIKGFKAGADGTWRAQLPDAAAGSPPGGMTFEQLFTGGRRAVRAREPDALPDSLFDVRLAHTAMESRIAKSHFSIAGVQQSPLGAGKASIALSVGSDAAGTLSALSPADWKNAILTVYHNWDDTRRYIKGYEGGAVPRIVTEGDSMKPWNPWKTGYLYHVENFPQALDQPGEWFLDPAGSLAYRPRSGEDPARTRVFAPALEKWIVFQGDIAAGKFVEHLRFRGLSFRYSQWLTPPEGFGPVQAAATIEAAVMADGARDLAFSDCEFAHTGGYGLWFRRGCRDIRVERCHIHDLGAGAVRIGETRIAPAGNERTSRITLDNNIIRAGGRLFPCAVGVFVGQSGDNAVTRNDIGDMEYTAISAGWTWGYGENLAKRNRFEGNHIYHIGKGLMSDLSGYYGLGLSEGTLVTGNVVHDIWAQTYGGWGLYTDEGSTGVVMSGNLVYNTKTGGFHQHYGEGNEVRGNIFAFGTQWQAQFTRAEAHLSFAFTGNILYWDQGALYSGAWDKGRTRLAGNLFWDATGKAPVFPGNLGLAAWQAAGHDSGSRSADPRFVDPERYDFRFQGGSPATGMGFAAIDPSKAGVYGNPAWVELARTGEAAAAILPVPGARESAGGAFRLDGFIKGPGGALRVRIRLGEAVSGLHATLADASGRKLSGKSWGPRPSGSIELAVPFAPSGSPPAAFLRLEAHLGAGRPSEVLGARIPPDL